jgi:hypothetical protein
MDTQSIIAYVIVALTVGYIIYKKFFKKNNNNNDCGTNCGCGK